MASENVAVRILREFGEPEVVARRYKTSPDYLIGPDLFPAFLMTSRIVLIVLAILFLAPVGIASRSIRPMCSATLVSVRFCR
jgi:hypothetical protein